MLGSRRYDAVAASERSQMSTTMATRIAAAGLTDRRPLRVVFADSLVAVQLGHDFLFSTEPVSEPTAAESTALTHLTASHLGDEDVVDGWSRRVGGKHVGLTASRAVLQIRRQDCRFRRTAYRQ